MAQSKTRDRSWFSKGGNGERKPFLSPAMRQMLADRSAEALGLLLGLAGLGLMAALFTYVPTDPSANTASSLGQPVHNLFGVPGAWFADFMVQWFGNAAYLPLLLVLAWAWRLSQRRPVRRLPNRLMFAALGMMVATMALDRAEPALVQAIDAVHVEVMTALGWTGVALPPPDALAPPPGGAVGVLLSSIFTRLGIPWYLPAGTAAVVAAIALFLASGISIGDWLAAGWGLIRFLGRVGVGLRRGSLRVIGRGVDAARSAVIEVGDTLAEERGVPSVGEHEVRERREPVFGPAATTVPSAASAGSAGQETATVGRSPAPVIVNAPAAVKPASGGRDVTDESGRSAYECPSTGLLRVPAGRAERQDETTLSGNARALEGVLGDFGVKGAIAKVHPGPVVTLYELEPAPGTKSSRVIGLSDDIARSMSAASVRVAVVPGRNVIGIELPNPRREIVLLRELLESDAFVRHQGKLVLALGKDIGGGPVVADLSRFPHLLVAGTTGSGKSVAINTMILSLLYRLPPERCRLILVDPKMLELSVYDGIPHLLAPVVTDPKKAVVALKWAVREMEDRYRSMSKLGVRNIEGYNIRLREAKASGELLTRRVQTGFDPDTGKPLFEEQPLDLTELPYIVVVVDEMADLMLVAGKDIEAAIQRLAQMARAAGIHLIMATQRPSVDVITGTIKANFPTRISFQVTSKIDSRTILGEQGAEQLLGQGDMLYMQGGGRITRVHGPFVSDTEVEAIVRFLKSQGEPAYVEAVTEEDEEAAAEAGGDGRGGSGDELYDKAVAVVCRERKASTSFVQRQLRVGYNSAARLIERMEAEGVVSKPNHAGKREVLARNIDET